MATIRLATNSFTVIPEGDHIFRIYKVDYDADFGKLSIYLVNAKGNTHVERFRLMGNDGSINEKALAAFSFFAKTALNDFGREEIDPNELVNHFIGGKITHTVTPSNTDPTKNVTFANIGDKWVVNGFDTTPTEKALTLGMTVTPSVTPTEPTTATKGVDLNSLLD